MFVERGRTQSLVRFGCFSFGAVRTVGYASSTVGTLRLALSDSGLAFGNVGFALETVGLAVRHSGLVRHVRESLLVGAGLDNVRLIDPGRVDIALEVGTRVHVLDVDAGPGDAPGLVTGMPAAAGVSVREVADLGAVLTTSV